MDTEAHFRVDPRLAALLSENYRSSEAAIKELVDNAWDADAENVWIELPDAMTDAPVVVRDDGTGMKEKEVKAEYLNIANARLSRKGERTPGKNRLVKGRKGIGKFAGLIAASAMELETKAQGKLSRLVIEKEKLLAAHSDLEKVPLPMTVTDCSPRDHGTAITLRNLNPKLSFPQEDRLKSLLVLEYGRASDFAIFVNDERVAHEDIPGRKFTHQVSLPESGPVSLNYVIMEGRQGTKASGVALRVNGKIVGKPHCFGLEEDPEVPPALCKRIVGEIIADGLTEDITADFGAVIENSKAYQELASWIRGELKQSVEAVFKNEVNLAKARIQQDINRRLEKLPEYRRHFAHQQLERVMIKFFGQGETEERVGVLVSLVLDAFEKDEYWTVCQKIEQASQSDVRTFADALHAFGICDLAFIGQQAVRRLEFLDNLDKLTANPETHEKEMHLALENNLWVFGVEYSLMSSNTTLKRVIEEFTAKKFKGQHADKRPDLLLSSNVVRNLLLTEFKRPSIAVGREAEAQAKTYRDILTATLGETMQIIIVGGSVDSTMREEYAQGNIRFMSYSVLISNARTQLQWLLKELAQKPS